MNDLKVLTQAIERGAYDGWLQPLIGACSRRRMIINTPNRVKSAPLTFAMKLHEALRSTYSIFTSK